MNHLRSACVLLLVLALAGCEKPVEVPPQQRAQPVIAGELAFADQIAEVKSGKRDRIQVERNPIDDEQLQKLNDARQAEVLLLDHPDNKIGESGIALIATMPKLMHLRLRGVNIDDAAAARLAKVKSLQILNLPQSELTDSGLAELTKLENLVQLRVGSSKLTDSGLEALKQFPKLKRVHLIDVPITDAGLAVFESLPKLESLYIDGGNVSDAAYERLFKAKPGLHVHVDQAHHDRDPNAHPH